jgi:hypothetical protein
MPAPGGFAAIHILSRKARRAGIQPFDLDSRFRGSDGWILNVTATRTTSSASPLSDIVNGHFEAGSNWPELALTGRNWL